VRCRLAPPNERDALLEFQPEVDKPSFGIRPMSRDRRQKRDLHSLDDEGMVLCNPRDREAAHRPKWTGSPRMIAPVDVPEVLIVALRARQSPE
jgi:hypothetical protein